jgi:hypothetical protein
MDSMKMKVQVLLESPWHLEFSDGRSVEKPFPIEMELSISNKYGSIFFDVSAPSQSAEVELDDGSRRKVNLTIEPFRTSSIKIIYGTADIGAVCEMEADGYDKIKVYNLELR